MTLAEQIKRVHFSPVLISHLLEIIKQSIF